MQRQQLAVLLTKLQQNSALMRRVSFGPSDAHQEPMTMKLRDAILFFLTVLAKMDRLRRDARVSHDVSEAEDPLQGFVDAIAQLSVPGASNEESETESWLLPCFRRDGLSIQNIAELFDFSGKECEKPDIYQQPLRLWDFISKPHREYK